MISKNKKSNLKNVFLELNVSSQIGFKLSLLILGFLTSSCSQNINNPYSGIEQKDDSSTVRLYASFAQRPKHLDPAKSYSSDESLFTNHIYEPILQYHYLKRPYELEPLTAKTMPKIRYFNASHQEIDGNNSKDVAYSIYDIIIKKNVRYQPHACFVEDNLKLSKNQINELSSLYDLSRVGTRELTAHDYVYQIKRLADPKLNSPIFGMISEYIIGMKDLHEELLKIRKERQKNKDSSFLNLTQFDLKGVKIVNSHHYQIKIKGKYPQFNYWLAMPFFAPIPVEADQFYSQKGLKEKNITLDWYPVGTGPYYLAENNPNFRMRMKKNPYYHDDFYPSSGESTDQSKGLLKDANKKLPFIDEILFSLETESLPYWNKFLQGYYDASGISSESFSQAIQTNKAGEKTLTPSLEEKKIQLSKSPSASIAYFGFNMLDPVVGGLSDSSKKLRQAISIALDYEEYIDIFLNGRGIPAQMPIPPGLFGYEDTQSSMNSTVYQWDQKLNKPKRKSIEEAKKLLSEAGYPNGINPKTGQRLVLNLDNTASGPDDKARIDWLRKQFNKLNIELSIRSTDYNRFQEKMLKGNAQLYQWGWNADYPDPENFMFLLYGKHGKVKYGGENASNYENPKFDQLFDQMKNLENSPQRLELIRQMNKILQDDSPWVWGVYPVQYTLRHTWYQNAKPNSVINNSLKYLKINVNQRNQLRNEWNQPAIYPIILGVLFVGGAYGLARYFYRRQDQRTLKN